MAVSDVMGIISALPGAVAVTAAAVVGGRNRMICLEESAFLFHKKTEDS